MPRIRYRDYKPVGDSEVVVARANIILREFSNGGWSPTLRQVYYQFIARDWFPDSWADAKLNGSKNTEANYKKLGNILSSAREGGLLDWDHLKDRTRSVKTGLHWRDQRDFLASVVPQFGIDLWDDQPVRVMVFVEKEALVEQVGRAARRLDVPYFANKGYLSASSVWEIAHYSIRVWHQTYGQNTVILHLGDHDPSGMNMTVDIEKRLKLFSSPTDEEFEKFGRPDVTVQRIALNMSQVEEFNPPPSPVKSTDSRSARYESEFGSDCWELDALSPDVMMSLVTEGILEHIDIHRFEAREALAANARSQLQEINDRYEEVCEALGLESIDCVVPPRPPTNPNSRKRKS